MINTSRCTCTTTCSHVHLENLESGTSGEVDADCIDDVMTALQLAIEFGRLYIVKDLVTNLT
jgi:hypothetical protein